MQECIFTKLVCASTKMHVNIYKTCLCKVQECTLVFVQVGVSAGIHVDVYKVLSLCKCNTVSTFIKDPNT